LLKVNFLENNGLFNLQRRFCKGFAMTALSKAQIIDVALALLMEKGFANVSTRDVATATEMSRSHLYYYFKDWASLRLAAFEHFARTELDLARQTLSSLEANAALNIFLKDCLPVSRDSTWTLWLDAWHEAMRSEDFAVVYMQFMKEWTEILAEIIKRGCATGVFKCAKPEKVARQLFALVNGYAGDLLVMPSKALANLALKDTTEVVRLLLQQDLVYQK
jgi:AcrR family transcriptional regulator